MASRPIKLLLVDDWQSVRWSLEVFFKAYTDFEVVGEAGDGAEAIAQCEDLQPDVVLMDVFMPHMDGITATKRIHQQFPDIRVIILTISIDAEITQAALSVGASKVLSKPYDLLRLTDAIREHF